MKKGDMSLNYIFLIFIGTIAVFIVVDLLSNWAFSTKKFMEKLQGSDDDTEIDAQVVKVGFECTGDIIKHAKLCWTKFNQGLVRSNLCYVINGCNTFTEGTVADALHDAYGLVDPTNLSITATVGVDNIAIYVEPEGGRFRLVIG